MVNLFVDTKILLFINNNIFFQLLIQPVRVRGRLRARARL